MMGTFMVFLVNFGACHLNSPPIFHVSKSEAFTFSVYSYFLVAQKKLSHKCLDQHEMIILQNMNKTFECCTETLSMSNWTISIALILRSQMARV